MKRRPFSALRFAAGHAVGLHLVDAREVPRDVDFERLEAAGRIEFSDEDRAAVAEAIAWVAVADRLQAKRLSMRALRARLARARRRGEEAADGPEEAWLAYAAARGAEPQPQPRGRPIEAAVHEAVARLAPIWRRRNPGRVGVTYDPIGAEWTGSLVEFLQEALRQAGVPGDQRRSIARSVREGGP